MICGAGPPAPPTTVFAIWSRLMSDGRRDALDLQLELVDVGRPAQRFLVRDEPLLEQAEDRLIEGLHAVLRRARGDRAVDQVRLVLVDDAVADEGRADHHFDRRRAALAVDPRHQALRDDGLQHARELQADLLLLVRREDRDDAVDRFGRVERVQRREHEVAGFGGEQRRFRSSRSRAFRRRG